MRLVSPAAFIETIAAQQLLRRWQRSWASADTGLNL
jgi:hypothetical protein